jgi:hypothetical protein
MSFDGDTYSRPFQTYSHNFKQEMIHQYGAVTTFLSHLKVNIINNK